MKFSALRDFAIFCILASFPSFAFAQMQIKPAVTQSSSLLGDVNGDGTITLDDATLIKNHLLEKDPLTGDALARADADSDGQVTMADVVYVNTHLTLPHQEVTVTLPGGVPLVLVKIPHGSFQMGSPDTERSRYSNEGPVHTVNIGYDYYMGKYLLTQKQWLAVMGKWPDSYFNPIKINHGLGDNYPAYYISWDDCQNYVTALNAYIASTHQGSATFRLPSESEWEYACRAGTQTRFYFGDSLSVDDGGTDGPAGTLPGNRSDYMWYYFNYNTPTYGSKLVGTKLPNQFGLYDMSGNEWEWCQDWYHTDYSQSGRPDNGSAWETQQSGYPLRVLRGGYWDNQASSCRSADRVNNAPASRNYPYGVRLSWIQ